MVTSWLLTATEKEKQRKNDKKLKKTFTTHQLFGTIASSCIPQLSGADRIVLEE